jgi:hypothetical protein
VLESECDGLGLALAQPGCQQCGREGIEKRALDDPLRRSDRFGSRMALTRDGNLVVDRRRDSDLPENIMQQGQQSAPGVDD